MGDQVKQELIEAQVALKKQIERKAMACVCSLYEFVLTFWGTVSGDDLVDNWHIKWLCDYLQEYGERLAMRGKWPPDLIINIPPGTTKSTLVTIMFPVWLWLHAPHFVIITTSYSSGLSRDHGLKSKAVVDSELFNELFQWYFERRFGKSFFLIKETEVNWQNNFNGSRIITSTNGTVTGKHGHLIIRDDPINPEQAESKAYRIRSNRYNDLTLSSRKVDKKRTPTITVMQRLHDEDSTGHDLKKKGKRIEHICMPGELTDDVKPEEIRKYYIGGLLDPERLSREVLDQMKLDLGSYGYAGQVLQTPIKAGGNMIKEEWFGRFSLIDLKKEVYNFMDVPWNFTIDSAYTDKGDGDATAILAYCKLMNNLYIRDCAAVRLEMPELLKFIPEFVYRNGYNSGSRIYIEPKASGLSVAQMMKRNTDLNIIIDEPPTASKEQRVAEASPFMEAGRCYLLDGASFIRNFLEELKIFPLADHDDQVDVLTMAIRRSREQIGVNIVDLSAMLP